MKRTKLFLMVVVLAVLVAACFPDHSTTGPQSAPDSSGKTTRLDCASLPVYDRSDYTFELHEFPPGPELGATAANPFVIDHVQIPGGLAIQGVSHIHITNSCITGNGPFIVTVRPTVDPHSPAEDGRLPEDIVFDHDDIQRQNSAETTHDCAEPTGPVGDPPIPAVERCIADQAILLQGGTHPDADTETTIANSELHNIATGIADQAGQTVVVGNDLHDLHDISGLDHVDGYFTNGGISHVQIRGNNIDLSPLTQTGPIALYDDPADSNQPVGPTNPLRPDDDVLIDSNQVSGGSFCMYNNPLSTNQRITNNTFVTNAAAYPGGRCADSPTGGFVTSFASATTGNVCTGNTDNASPAGAVLCTDSGH